MRQAQRSLKIIEVIGKLSPPITMAPILMSFCTAKRSEEAFLNGDVTSFLYLDGIPYCLQQSHLAMAQDKDIIRFCLQVKLLGQKDFVEA